MQNVRACFEAKTMHTVNKNNFHLIYLLQNYNIKINTSQKQFTQKPLYSQTQARSQKTAMGGRLFQRSGGVARSAQNFCIFLAKITILGLF